MALSVRSVVLVVLPASIAVPLVAAMTAASSVVVDGDRKGLIGRERPVGIR